MRLDRLSLTFPLMACAVVSGAPHSSKQPAASALQKYSRLPLAFEHEQSGLGKDRYVAHGEGYAIMLNGVKTSIAIHPRGAAICMELAGARPVLSIPGPELPGKVNYILGNDSRRWRLGLPTYESVTYRDIYPGIDAVYRGNRQQLEFDLVVKPGSDPSRVRLKFAGAQNISLAPSGELLLTTAAGPLHIALPSVYQDKGAVRTTVRGSFRLAGRNEAAFVIGRYDRTQALVIDPTIVYSTLLGGGTGGTNPQAIAVDSSGNGYIAGFTSANDFPTANPAQAFQRGFTNGFISKINAAGSALVYSTYIGGTSLDYLYGIAIDGSGAAWVTGQTSSTDFPVMGAYQSGLGSTLNAVVAKLSPSGSLAYSTYLGAASQATGTGIAVDSAGNAYATGIVLAPGFPTTPGAFLTAPPGGLDSYVMKFSSTGTVAYSTLLGGTGNDSAHAIAVDSSGNAYVTGGTTSATFNGVSASVRTTNAGGVDAFVAKLNATGAGLTYLAIVGGSGLDIGTAIAVDASGNAYIGGNTFSPDLATTAGAAQSSYGGDQDGFVAKLNSAGAVFPLITYIGGSRPDSIAGLALDSAGVYITGTTQSGNFPTFSPFLSQIPGNSNSAFVTTNAGASWAAFDTNIPGAVRDLSPDPSHPGVIVAATDAGIFRTANGGSTWSSQSTTSINLISRSPANSDLIYGFFAATPYVSVDGGLTWTAKPALGATPTQVIADPTNANTAYVLVNGVLKTTDGGNTWNPSNTGLPSAGALTQSMVAASDGTLFVSVAGAGIYRSTNHAVSWNPVNAGLPSSFTGTYHLAVAPGNPSVLYASNGTVYTTTNAGGTWSPTGGNIPDNNAGLIAVSPSNTQVLYATSNDAPTVDVSLDGGATWNPAGAGLGVAIPIEIVTDPTNGSRLFAVAAVNQVGFVSKLNTAGNAFVYSSYLAGSSSTNPAAIATDGAHNAFVTGWETGGFPTTASALPKTGFSTEGFAVRISDTTSACLFSVVPGNQLVYGSYQTLTYNVLAPSGCAWTASSNQAWAPIVSGASGAGSGSVFVETTQNIGTTRSATLTIAGQTLTLNQAGAACGYSLSNSAPVISGAGGNLQVNVIAPAGCDWAVVNNYPSAISILSGGSGTGNGAVSLNVAANNSNQSRSFIVPIGTTTLFITQGYECLYSINPMLVHLGTAGGSGTVNVTTASGCAWTATGASFVTITSGASGSGSGTVTYNVPAIPLSQGRTGTLTIAGQTFTVQEGTLVRDFRGIGRSGALLYDAAQGPEYTALSNGDGTYQYIPNIFTPGFDTLRTGDYNGDGKADLVVYNSQTALAYIGLGKGDGTFNFQSLFWSPGYDFVEPGDLNADGKTDFVLYNSSTGTVYTAISNGDGTFTYMYLYIGPGYTFVRLADFTGDGKADLFVYNASKGYAYLGIGDGTGGFTSFSQLLLSQGYNLADLGDLNGDGLADIILYNSTNGNAATGISNGSGGFTFLSTLFSPGFTSVRLANYTGHRTSDVTLYNQNSGVAYFGTGNGTGSFTFQSLFWSPDYNVVEPEDVNGDGKADIILYNSPTGTEYTGLSNGNGTFTYTYSYWGIGRTIGR